MNARMKVIFDNDASTDDFMALAALVLSPKAKVLAVTLAATGEAHAEAGIKNLADICHLLGETDMPIAYGSSVPCAPHVGFPEDFRAQIDKSMDTISFERNPQPNFKPDAVELMRQALEQSADKVTIVATGPLTNVAHLLQKHPALHAKIADVVIMGGAVRVAGNIQALDQASTNEVAEWNIYADPKAAEMVFASGVPVTLVPLDATNQVPFTKAFYELLSLQQQPALKVIYQLLKLFVDQYGDKTFEIYYLWDALAAMIAMDKNLAKLEHLSIRMDLQSGQTCLDPAGTTNIWVATGVNEPETVLGKLLDLLKTGLLRSRLQAGLAHTVMAPPSAIETPIAPTSRCQII